jgi:signal peptidase I
MNRVRRQSRGLWMEYRSFLGFMLLMFMFRSAWADWMHVPTGSMNPTIIEGDRILVDKHVYGIRVPWTLVRLTSGADPARGDIVVFDSPRDGTTLVKRVIAIPGDTVALYGEQLLVNGVPAHYELGDQTAVRELLTATQRQSPVLLQESGPGWSHEIQLLPQRRAAATLEPITIPPGRYFMLGDNRDNSADSRYIGLVPRRNIVGRATRVVASFNPERYWLPRADRYWQMLD